MSTTSEPATAVPATAVPATAVPATAVPAAAKSPELTIAPPRCLPIGLRAATENGVYDEVEAIKAAKKAAAVKAYNDATAAALAADPNASAAAKDAAKAAAAAAAAAVPGESLKELKKKIPRAGVPTRTALSACASLFAERVVEAAMRTALRQSDPAKRPLVKTASLMAAGDIDPFRAALHRLPSYDGWTADLERAEEEALKQREAAKRAFDNARKRARVAGLPEPEPAAVPALTPKDHDYARILLAITPLIKSVKARNRELSAVVVATRFKEFVATLTLEFIELIFVSAKAFAKILTISPDHIREAARTCALPASHAEIDSHIKRHLDTIPEMKQAREARLAAEDPATAALKKAQAELKAQARLRANAAAAQKRAQAAAEKAAKLAAEVAALA